MIAVAAKAVAVASIAIKRKQTLNPAAISGPAADILTSTSGSRLHDRTTVTKKIEKKKSAETAAAPVVPVSETVVPVSETVVPGSARLKAPVRQESNVESVVNAQKDLALAKVRAVTSAPVPSPAGPANVVSAEPALEPAPVEKTARPAKAPNSVRQGFKPLEYIVYPAHGVGQIVAIEEQEVAGFKLELFVIIFVKDKMILKVPVPKVASVGMRKLAEADVVKKALNTLAGRARIKRTMWSRRAQEYEAKINSGDLVAISEVVRDLYRSDSQPEQSYSERQLYEAALDRMAREVVVVHKLTETESLKLIEAQLQKGPRRGKAEDVEADDTIEEAA
jgi:CarD family transcriptional regulator